MAGIQVWNILAIVCAVAAVLYIIELFYRGGKHATKILKGKTHVDTSRDSILYGNSTHLNNNSASFGGKKNKKR
jgi:hypothetical protein